MNRISPTCRVLILKLGWAILTLNALGDASAPNPGNASSSAAGNQAAGLEGPKGGFLTPASGMALREDVSLDYAYVGDSKLKSGGKGNLGEQSTDFAYAANVQFSDHLSFRFGLNYNRLDFGRPAGSPLPNNLQTISPSFGAEYKLTNQWGVFGALAPRLELIDNGNQIESQDFQLGAMVGASYNPNEDLSLRLGLAINPGALNLPVLPVVGVRWHFAKPWTLNLGLPRTSLDYQILPNLVLSPIEIGFEGGAFHTSKNYGSSVGMPQLNDRKLEYNEVRVGAGIGYMALKNLQVNLSAGAAVYRDFDFKDASFSPKADPAPFVQLGARVGF
jgi:opacity protein-like surface antigen